MTPIRTLNSALAQGGNTVTIPRRVAVEIIKRLAGDRELSRQQSVLLAELETQGILSRQDVADLLGFKTRRTAEVAIHRLRQRLEETGSEYEIVTVYGRGYRLEKV